MSSSRSRDHKGGNGKKTKAELAQELKDLQDKVDFLTGELRRKDEALEAQKVVKQSRNEKFAVQSEEPDVQTEALRANYNELEAESVELNRMKDTLEKYRLFSVYTRDIVLFVRRDGRIIEANEAAIKAYGYSREELLSLSIYDLRAADPGHRVDVQMDTAFERGILFEALHRRKDGSIISVEVSSQGRIISGQKVLLSVIRDITERKRAEEALQASNETINKILRSIQDDFYVLDRDWNFVYTSTSFTSRIGKEPKDFIGNNIWEMFPKHLGTILEENYRAAMDKREMRRFELHGQYTDHWYRMTVYPSAEGITLLGTDITDSKRAEEALREREEQFRNLFLSINEGFYIARILYDDNGKPYDFLYIEVNAAFENILGMGRDQILGKRFTELVPDYSSGWMEIFKGVALTGTPAHYDFYSEAFQRHFETLVYRPVEGQLAVLVSDVTGRKQADLEKEQLLGQIKERSAELQKANVELEIKSEELAAQAEEIESSNEELRANNDELQSITSSLRETSDYLESLINYANAPIIVWDPHFTITRFNHAFEHLSGYTANEVIGRHLSILFPRDSSERSLDLINKTLAGEQWESVEIPIQHKSGSNRIALWNSANIYNGDKKLLATIAQGQDITERKRAEKDLAEAKDQAELYIDLMGHDISNMHQIMMMQLEIAGEIINANGRLEADDRQYIDVPFKTLERAAQLIDNVRKLQKLRSGEYKTAAVDLGKVLEDALNEYSGIPGRDININYAAVYGYLVLANPLLKDVFGNLMDNAVKHSNGRLEIGVDVHRVGLNGSSFYRVTIEDNGNGIPDDKKEEVFHRFKRGQTKARGTGLGLYLVKNLVEGFGGYVEVQNRVLGDYTKGTRFLVYLPVMDEKNF